MTTRPPIPVELRRRVLLEAGHRCAISRCTNQDIDVHHIVPWERCKKHEFDNLIALCPNCHRRVHDGKIDRKALFLYKASLTTPQHSSHEVGYGEEVTTDPRWETDRLVVEETTPTKLSAEIEYPVFHSGIDDLIALNAVVKGEAHASLLAMRRRTAEFELDMPNMNAECGHIIASSFQVTLLTNFAISMSISEFTYMAGTLHGNHETFGRNYLLSPLREFQLADMFQDSKSALQEISSHCSYYLGFEDHHAVHDEIICSGVAPEWNNFRSFYLTPSELVIVFQPYQVGSHATGTRFVPLSARYLAPMLVPDSPFTELYG